MRLNSYSYKILISSLLWPVVWARLHSKQQIHVHLFSLGDKQQQYCTKLLSYSYHYCAIAYFKNTHTLLVILKIYIDEFMDNNKYEVIVRN
jgi:hypothetical protein